MKDSNEIISTVEHSYENRGKTVALIVKGTHDWKDVDIEQVYDKDQVLQQIARMDIVVKWYEKWLDMLKKDLDLYIDSVDEILEKEQVENEKRLKSMEVKLKLNDEHLANREKELDRASKKKINETTLEQQAKIDFLEVTIKSQEGMREDLMNFLKEEKKTWFTYINKNYEDAYSIAKKDFETKSHKGIM